MDFGMISAGLGGAGAIDWTDEPWDRRYIKRRRDKEPLDRMVVSDEPGFRDRIRGATWGDYDLIVVSYSGGKDSHAALQHLLDAGAPKSKIELWHQNVDGEHDAPAVMDWPITRDYIESVAEALGLPLLYQWRGRGGLVGEILRRGQRMAPMFFESPVDPLGPIASGRPGRSGQRVVYEIKTEAGHLQGRMGVPAVSDNLQVRWCSDVGKMEPFARALRNDPRLSRKRLGRNPRILVVTGERRLEGKKGDIEIVDPRERRRTIKLGGRAVYHQLQPHETDARTRRDVDHWRPVLNYSDADVWQAVERSGVRAHPGYELGPWGRCSCVGCIYSSPAQMAAFKQVLPEQFERLAAVDEAVGRQGRRTWREKKLLRQFVGDLPSIDPEALAFWEPYLIGRKKITPAVVRRTGRWRRPAGASAGDAGGSTNIHPTCWSARHPEAVLARYRARHGRRRPDPRTVEGRLAIGAAR